MVPASPDASPVDSQFDLDVRLEAVARQVSPERGEKPPDQQTMSCAGSCYPGGYTCIE
jgi:hypothetical protein